MTNTEHKLTKQADGIIKLVEKPQKHEAIQYTGKNGKDIVDFVASSGLRARAGGGWVKIFEIHTNDSVTVVKKGEYVVRDEKNHFVAGVFTEEQLKKRFNKSK